MPARRTQPSEGQVPQIASGWFVTPNVLMTGEYVVQEYNGFPPTNIRHGGTFHGLMLEGVIGF
jgi:hypothetical protein